MATGDDALAAGMDLVPGTALANTIETELNKTRDYIAQRTSTVQPVANGGTGSTTASGARTNLAITPENIGAAKNDGAYTLKIGYVGSNHVRARVDNGATTYMDQTLANSSDLRSDLIPRLAGGTVEDGINAGYSEALNRVAKSGDTMTGHLYLPASSAATSSWTTAYINGDGRVSRGSSSERYKKFISDVDPESLGDIFPQFVRYQMRGGDGSWRYGYIAESLVGTDAEPFVVYVDGQVESIDFNALLMAQNAQLRQQLDALTARIEALETPE